MLFGIEKKKEKKMTQPDLMYNLVDQAISNIIRKKRKKTNRIFGKFVAYRIFAFLGHSIQISTKARMSSRAGLHAQIYSLVSECKDTEYRNTRIRFIQNRIYLNNDKCE